MRHFPRRLAAILALFAFGALAGCGGSDDSPTDPNGDDGSISITLSSTSITIAPGENETVTVTVNRQGGFTGSVDLSAQTPSGISADPVTVGAGSTSGTLTFEADAGREPGTVQATVQATGSGVDAASATLSIQVVAADDPAFTLALGSATLSLEQGASNDVVVTITRTGGFGGEVALSLSGLPNGVTHTFDPSETVGTTSQLTLSAGAGAAVGTSALTVTGTAAGLDDRTATLGLTVTEADGGGTGNVAWSVCEDIGIPDWFAYRDGSGSWTRVTPDAGNVYRFQIDQARGSVAWAEADAGSSEVQVMHFSRDELIFVGANQCDSGTDGKTVHGTVANLAATQTASVSLGGGYTTVSGGAGGAFTLNNVPDGPQDLVAGRASFDMDALALVPDRMIIRRGLEPADGATLAALDFDAEGFAMASADLTINGLGSGEQSSLVGMFTTQSGSLATYFAGIQGDASMPYWGVPNDRLESNDLHWLQIVGADLSGSGSGEPPATRQLGVAFRQVEDRSVTLGPPLADPTVASIATSPYARFSASWVRQTEYERFVGFILTQSGGSDDRSFVIFATDGYLGAGGTVQLEVPDLTGVAGWDDAWGLSPSASAMWTVTGSGWAGDGAINFPEVTEGTVYHSATRSGEIQP
ncbi:MAG: hypothetical protein WD960_07045 [Gemmatimonadota bacterium]